MAELIQVFHAEDDSQWSDQVRDDLEEVGFTTNGTLATNRQSAIEMIPKLIAQGVRLAILDGRIPNNVDDGRVISLFLRERIPEIFILSLNSLDEKPNWADEHICKNSENFHGYTPELLAQTIIRANQTRQSI